ncbi:hypothetical protein CONCODRAFT_9991 [Conidiobolus coronatus NRRL 28638]|uniref:Uncharacterized protein n=1 Tax=Conidiobolus coronatus (strain ATCC 28846 / CBS 209.66 / NRRL 28638) TaxID=796925 RepID=A0A137NZ42_CONC2|nr:hypothetical protein CONCODRAFT_9991 [Conidiobolus coronatus NRRL 28638]|eukprot:KXN67859.1 hypothetical protein CONCODRAFT_9991 [Conidiobolus coronatus NRRL 28638]
MYSSKLLTLFTILSFGSALNCPPGTPRAITIRGAWEHRWVSCENNVEGECPRDLQGPYTEPANDNCDNYLTESGDDYIINYYVCEKKAKFDELKPILEKNGWICLISE